MCPFFPIHFPTAEKDFVLEDRETEAKYSFKMKKTLERAKKNKGKLLDGKTFYLTQRVDVDNKLMKSVVAAHGGTVRFPRRVSAALTHYLGYTVVATGSYIPSGDLKTGSLCDLMQG